MSFVGERNFHNFHLGDDVYKLAGVLIPEIAERLDVDLGTEPNSDALGTLVGKLGSNKVLRDNEDVTAIDRETAIAFVERSGVQEPLARSLWTPYVDIDSASVDNLVLTGGVANWQDRSINLALQHQGVAVFYPVGNRVMKTATEVEHPEIKKLYEVDGTYPTETEFVKKVVTDRFVQNDQLITPSYHDTGVGDEIATQFFMRNPFALGRRLAAVRNANAGILFATQLRAAARKRDASFDADINSPQLFVVTDGFPLARTDEQEADPANYQKAITALRQVAVTAKVLHEAALDL